MTWLEFFRSQIRSMFAAGRDRGAGIDLSYLVAGMIGMVTWYRIKSGKAVLPESPALSLHAGVRARQMAELDRVIPADDGKSLVASFVPDDRGIVYQAIEDWASTREGEAVLLADADWLGVGVDVSSDGVVYWCLETA